MFYYYVITLLVIAFIAIVILTALTLYFLNNSSTRAISQFLMINSGIKISHVTIAIVMLICMMQVSSLTASRTFRII